MKKIKGRVISTLQQGKVAEIQTSLGTYGINKVVRTLIHFRSLLKPGENVLLTIDPSQRNSLLGIEKGD